MDDFTLRLFNNIKKKNDYTLHIGQKENKQCAGIFLTYYCIIYYYYLIK